MFCRPVCLMPLLCCTVLFFTVNSAVLYSALLCCTVNCVFYRPVYLIPLPCCTVLCCNMRCVFYSAVQCSAVLCFTVWFAVLYNALLCFVFCVFCSAVCFPLLCPGQRQLNCTTCTPDYTNDQSENLNIMKTFLKYA